LSGDIVSFHNGCFDTGQAIWGTVHIPFGTLTKLTVKRTVTRTGYENVAIAAKILLEVNVVTLAVAYRIHVSQKWIRNPISPCLVADTPSLQLGDARFIQTDIIFGTFVSQRTTQHALLMKVGRDARDEGPRLDSSRSSGLKDREGVN
jgi:hypothetical protein